MKTFRLIVDQLLKITYKYKILSEMGCGKSRQKTAEDKKVVTDISQINLDELSRAQRFEMQIPISLTDVEVYCQTIKKIKDENKGRTTLTPKELIDGMNAVPAWKKIPDDSIFHQILEHSKLLQAPNGELSTNALLLWGIVLCGGKSAVKVKAFYDVLQDNQQERISADDKDFPSNFTLMIDLTTVLVNEYEAKYSGKEPELSAEQISKIDNFRDTLAENDFLDPVFGNNSNLLRAEWEQQVLT